MDALQIALIVVGVVVVIIVVVAIAFGLAIGGEFEEEINRNGRGGLS